MTKEIEAIEEMYWKEKNIICLGEINKLLATYFGALGDKTAMRDAEEKIEKGEKR